MANKKVALVRKCKTPDGWRYYPVAKSANGKVKPDARTGEMDCPAPLTMVQAAKCLEEIYQAVANAGTEIMDAILDVSTRAGSHCRKKEDVARLRPAQWWNSPEPGTKPGRR